MPRVERLETGGGGGVVFACCGRGCYIHLPKEHGRFQGLPAYRVSRSRFYLDFSGESANLEVMFKALIPAAPASDYGPKMRALSTHGHRRFVLALLAQTHRNYSNAYLEAGYKAEGKSLNVCAYRLAHDERIQEALQEEAGRRLKALLPLALHTVEGIMENPQAKEADRIKVAFGVLDRSGLAATTEHKITVGLAGDTEMLARIKMLAERNGIPIEQYIGASLAKTIEHVPTPQSLTLETEVDEFADEEY